MQPAKKEGFSHECTAAPTIRPPWFSAAALPRTERRIPSPPVRRHERHNHHQGAVCGEKVSRCCCRTFTHPLLAPATAGSPCLGHREGGGRARCGHCYIARYEIEREDRYQEPAAGSKDRRSVTWTTRRQGASTASRFYEMRSFT
jgi:hypothetical protein